MSEPDKTADASPRIGRQLIVWDMWGDGRDEDADLARQAGPAGVQPEDRVLRVRWLRPDETPPMLPWEQQTGSADQ